MAHKNKSKNTRHCTANPKQYFQFYDRTKYTVIMLLTEVNNSRNRYTCETKAIFNMKKYVDI